MSVATNRPNRLCITSANTLWREGFSSLRRSAFKQPHDMTVPAFRPSRRTSFSVPQSQRHRTLAFRPMDDTASTV